MELVRPATEHLASYRDALGRGWSPDSLRPQAAADELEEIKAVELTTDVVNLASQRVITANGGVLVEEFTKPAAYGGAPSLRFRIFLPEH
jgi:predicted acetyltransferase